MLRATAPAGRARGGCARDMPHTTCPEPGGALNLWAGRGAQKSLPNPRVRCPQGRWLPYTVEVYVDQPKSCKPDRALYVYVIRARSGLRDLGCLLQRERPNGVGPTKAH